MTEDHETKQKILQIIRINPGIHLSKIAEFSEMKIIDVEKLLSLLEQEGHIFCTKKAGYYQYFATKHQVKNRTQRISNTRETIYNLIAQNPGIYLTKIAETLDMSLQLADYHLIYLERHKKIIVVKKERGYHKRYYVVDSRISDQEEQILEFLGKEIPLEIVLLLIKHQSLQHKELSDHLSISTSKLSYHLNNLVRSGIVELKPFGKKKGYVLKKKAEIIRIIKKYKLKIILDIAVEEFRGLWDHLNYEKQYFYSKLLKKLKISQINY